MENLDYNNELIAKKSLEFNLNNNSNTYEYYESLSEDQLSSVNLDDNSYFKFITEVIDFLEGDKPDFTSGCSFCDLKRNDFF